MRLMSSKQTIAVILAAFFSIVLAIAGYLWDIETFKFLFSFLAGVFSTYFVGKMLQKEAEKEKKRTEATTIMREEVYGPIFERLTYIVEEVEKVEPFDYESMRSLEELLTHHLFLTIEADTREAINTIVENIKIYEGILHAAEIMIVQVLRKKVEIVYHLDIGMNEAGVTLRLAKGEVGVSVATLKDLILKRIPPKKFVESEKRKLGNNLLIEISIGGKKSQNAEDLELLYSSVLDEVQKDPLYTEEGQRRTSLVNEIRSFLEKLRPYVTLEK